MTVIKREITYNRILDEVKAIVMRRINNTGDKFKRIMLLEVVGVEMCTDTVQLLSDDIMIFEATWGSIRSKYDQEALLLLMNTTADFLMWLSYGNIPVESLIERVVAAYSLSVPQGVEAVPNLDPANTVRGQSIPSDKLKKFLSNNLWYLVVILLSSSDIRYEIRAALQEEDSRQGAPE